jgi:hypothetical protein
MNNQDETLLSIVNFIISRNPRLAPAIIQLAKEELNKNGSANQSSSKDIFFDIYQQGLWGKGSDSGHRYFSGSGSHDPVIVSRYIKTISNFLEGFPKKMNVVDLGCGDFAIGSQLRNLCDEYVACDIVYELIEYNKIYYNDKNVDFRVVDMVNDELPKGDIAFVRQVFQHLSNDEISAILPKILKQYDFLVLTEHLPISIDFLPNIDKPTNCDIRLNFNSGIVLTKYPFNFPVVEERVLCEVPEYGGVVRTILYKLK